MKPLVSVLIVEQSDIIIEGLKSMLQDAGEFNILAPLHDVQSLVERVMAQKPDIIIVNPQLLGMAAQATVEQLRRSRPGMAVVAISTTLLPSAVSASFPSCIGLYDTQNSVVAMLRQMADGGEEENDNGSYELSERETEVLVLLAQGLSSKLIADKLNISVHTVNTHRKNITSKTGIRSIAGLTVYATLHNLI